MYSLFHAIAHDHTPSFYFILGAIRVGFDFDEEHAPVQFLVGWGGDAFPDSAVVETIVLSANGFGNVGVTAVVSEFMELAL
jgi:hypothetical protein